MSFREKFAWVMLIALALAAAFYFYAMWPVMQLPEFIAPASAGIGIVSVIILVVLVIIGATVAALSDVRSANATPDEREKDILAMAENVGATCLGAGVMLIIVLAHVLSSLGWVIPGLVGALVLSQIGTYLTQIVLYRVR